MLETDGGTVRKVAWLEIFPWLGLGRAFRVAISLRVLVFGALGFFLTLLGWLALGQVFFHGSSGHATNPYVEISRAVVAQGRPTGLTGTRPHARRPANRRQGGHRARRRPHARRLDAPGPAGMDPLP